MSAPEGAGPRRRPLVHVPVVYGHGAPAPAVQPGSVGSMCRRSRPLGEYATYGNDSKYGRSFTLTPSPRRPPISGLKPGNGAASTPPAGAVCSVDARVYVGWRVFHAQCAECHAPDAVGSSFAPDLTRRLRAMSAREFFEALDEGYTGPLDPSPPRGADPDVARYYDELWAYLRARASGELPAGTLARRPNAPRANQAGAASP